jgi:hypothetical protein
MARTGENKKYKDLAGKSEEKYESGDLGLNGWIMLKFILKTQDVRARSGFIWLR